MKGNKHYCSPFAQRTVSVSSFNTSIAPACSHDIVIIDVTGL